MITYSKYIQMISLNYVIVGFILATVRSASKNRVVVQIGNVNKVNNLQMNLFFNV